MGALRILLVGDIHYSGSPERGSRVPERNSKYGLELLRRLKRLVSRTPAPDALVFMGDLAEDGAAPGGAGDLEEIREEAGSFNIPAIFLPGNHDGDPRAFYRIFKPAPGALVVKGCLLYVFGDNWSEGDFASRSRESLDEFRSAVRKHARGKIVVFQHNPVYPPIDRNYPYNLTNAEEVHRVYRECGVTLSASAHYHRGQPLSFREGVGYITVPAFCEPPFPFTEISIEEDALEVSRGSLSAPFPARDNHCHTEFAYCGEDVTVESVAERAGLMGLGGITFAEHAGQLYLPREGYWRGDFHRHPELLRKRRDAGLDRMDDYRKSVAGCSYPGALAGLEVDTDKYGGLTVLPEDAAGFDVFVGAVHFMPDEYLGKGAGEIESRFMRANEALLEHGVDVIAHPFRFFLRQKLPVPGRLFAPLARMLKEAGAAAELNFHTNEPDPEFFALCAREGVKISLGSDAHNLLEVGDFTAHYRLLKSIGLDPEADPGLLWHGPPADEGSRASGPGKNP